MSLFKKLFGEKTENPFPETVGGNFPEELFEKMMKELIEEEKKKMDSMSRLELIDYAATTRVHLTYSYTLLNEAGEVIKNLQSTEKTIIETVNRIIRKQPVKVIELARKQ